MTLSLPAITAEDRRNFPSHTDSSIQGILLIKSLSVPNQMRLITGRNNMVRRAVVKAMGADTNPSWITSRAAEALYDFGAISEEEFDQATR